VAFQCAQNDRRAAFRSIAYFAEERVFWIVIAGSKMRRPRVNVTIEAFHLPLN